MDVATFTTQDCILLHALLWMWRGWPQGLLDPEFQPFGTRQHELSAHQGCLLWGNHVAIPYKLQRRVLEALHVGHLGIVRMKALARSYVWWLHMDKAVTEWVGTCQACQ